MKRIAPSRSLPSFCRGAGAAAVLRSLSLGALIALAAGCVSENTKTGELIPRGKQRYEFARVEKAAENLRIGMSKNDVLLLLGSPAELSEEGSVWIYLPERHGVIIPARALQLQFRDNLLTEHGYRAIVLGTKL